MSSKGTAAPAGAGVGPSRRKWDKEEFAAKAKARDDEDRERAKENEERMKLGKKPTKRRKEDLPKATELLKQREAPLELDKNVGKTLMVDAVGEGAGRRGPGYYCELCKRTCKDSIGYLDHINGRMHLRRMGQTTQVARSTVQEVRERIAQLREETAAGATAKAYDFDARIRAIAEEQQREKEARKRKRKEEMQKKKAPPPEEVDEQVMAAMGFGGFGGGKK